MDAWGCWLEGTVVARPWRGMMEKMVMVTAKVAEKSSARRMLRRWGSAHGGDGRRGSHGLWRRVKKKKKKMVMMVGVVHGGK